MAAAASNRETKEIIGYIKADPPHGAGILADLFNGGDFKQYKEGRRLLLDFKEVNFLDARKVPGGVDSFNLDVHGFQVIKPPPAVDFTNSRLVKKEYYAQLSEQVRQLMGAKEAYCTSHLCRDETNGKSGGNPGAGYARFAHADASRASPQAWRRMLGHVSSKAKGLPMSAEELASVDLCMVNIWLPRDRPAYKDPLCLLDVSSVNLADAEKGGDIAKIPFLKYESGQPKTWWGTTSDSVEDGLVGYLVGPSYSPNHRWYFLPDQTPDECLVFKQFDERNGGTQGCFHNSFHDHFYDDMPAETHGRRSVEFRMFLTFPKKQAAASSKL